MKDIIMEDWLVEFDIPAAAAQPDPPMGGGQFMDNPFGGGPSQDQAFGASPSADPSITNMPPANNLGAEEEDVENDPKEPDMPEMQAKVEDFEIWKKNYFKESIKGDPNSLLEFMAAVREQDDLRPYQRKFVEDNWNIQLLRLNSNIEKASKEVRKLIKQQLDRNNPSTSVINHLVAALESAPQLNHIFIKMQGYGASKGELHRKYLASLLGAVQVSSSHETENIIFNESEYSIKIATRCNSDWGEVPIGGWHLREDDAERYLSEPEVKRLSDGSPEERDVLRRRVVMESIAKKFEQISFIVHVVQDDGMIHAMGWDLANSLRGAYVEGKLVVKTKNANNSEAMIDENGAIIPLMDMAIYYVRDSGGQDEDGQPDKENVEFMQYRNGMVWLTAGMQTIREAATTMQGIQFKEIPYQGNPSDLQNLRRCVYSTHDLLMRHC